MTVTFEEEIPVDLGFDYDNTAKQVAERVLDSEGFAYEAEISVLLTGNEGIRALNKQHRGIDRPTDVLSFPMLDFQKPGEYGSLEETEDAFNPETGEVLLGDIVYGKLTNDLPATVFFHVSRMPIPVPLGRIIGEMCNKQPQLRPTMAQVMEVFSEVIP